MQEITITVTVFELLLINVIMCFALFILGRAIKEKFWKKKVKPYDKRSIITKEDQKQKDEYIKPIM